MRRLGNIDLLVKHDEEMGIIERFVREMKNSGYDRRAAREAVMSGLRGLEKRRERRGKDGGNFYRTAKETLPERMRKKLMESTTWYREEEGNNEQVEGEREFTESSWESQKNKEGEREGRGRRKLV
jgi:hypothetical protein